MAVVMCFVCVDGFLALLVWAASGFTGWGGSGYGDRLWRSFPSFIACSCQPEGSLDLLQFGALGVCFKFEFTRSAPLSVGVGLNRRRATK